MRPAFNGFLCVTEVVVISTCFGIAAALSLAPFPIVLAAGMMMLTLSLRDTYVHRSWDFDDKMPRLHRVYVDVLGDAVCTMVSLLAMEVLLSQVSPSMALGTSVLFRGSATAMTMTASLRLLFRPIPDPGVPGEPGKQTQKLFWKTFSLLIMWAVTFQLTVIVNTSDFPRNPIDFLRGFLFLPTLGLWLACQLNGLRQRVEVQTIFRDPEQKKLERLKELLPQGLQRGEPGYYAALALQTLVFIELSLFVMDLIEPWLVGQPGGANMVRAFAGLLGFATSASTWTILNKVARGTSDAMQAEIDERKRSRFQVFPD